MVDIGTLSLIVLIGMFVLLAIGMPLGFASAFLAVGIHAMTSRIATVSVTYGDGHMRDFEVGERAHLVICSEVGDRYRILIDGVRATVLESDVILQD